jgi:hypothetical protein
MGAIKYHGDPTLRIPVSIQEDMKILHNYFMKCGFPYHSVSVVYRPTDGLFCHFVNDVKDKVTPEVILYIKSYNANYIINQPHAG